jgi:hypothetical protein
MTERTTLLQTSCSKKESLQQLYGQKLELVAQVKADVADLDNEHQLIVDAFRQEKQKILNLTRELLKLQQQQKSTVSNMSQPQTDLITNGCESPSDDQSLDPADHVSSPSGQVWQCLMNLEAETLANKPWNSDSGSSDDVIMRRDDDVAQPVTRSCDTDDSVFGNDVISELSDVSTSEGKLNGDNGLSSSGNTIDDVFDSSFQSCSGSPVTSEQTNGFVDRNNEHNAAETARNTITSGSGSSSSRDVKLRKKRIVQQSRPLTRYLPVRDSGLNLRQFIESSGHCLDDSASVVQLTATTCQGTLTKMARHGLHVWHRRWFVFDRSRRTFSWHSTRPNSAAAAGRSTHCLAFADIVDVFVDHLRTAVRSPVPHLTFCIKSRDVCYYLVAPTAEAMRIWIDVLVTGAEGHTDYL